MAVYSLSESEGNSAVLKPAQRVALNAVVNLGPAEIKQCKENIKQLRQKTRHSK